MADSLLLALDQGTSSSRAVLYDGSGRPVASATAPLPIHYPAEGWVEQDADAIWRSQLEAMRALEERLDDGRRQAVAACGVTNQRETTVLWQRGSGDPLAPAVVWQDGRTAAICRRWKEAGLEAEWRRRTGLLLDPYFSASKIAWLLEHSDAAAAAAADGSLCFGTVESWLLQRLAEGRPHLSDMSNASRTLLMDLESRRWVPEFAAECGLPLSALPELRPCRGDFGRIAAGLPFAGVPIRAMLGDQQAATLGQLCLAPGQAKCTYGTGAFLVINTGAELRRSDRGLLSTIAWTDAAGHPTYCLEGSLFNAGTVVQWLRDGLGLIERSEAVNELAAEVEHSAGVMLVPAFTGWGTPHWDPAARGLLIGLTRDTRRGHIARAALEGIALSVATLVDLAEEAMGGRLSELAVDGGAAASDPLLQAQADASGVTVRRPADLESTARGVALLAGLEAGVLDAPTDFEAGLSGAGLTRFLPRMGQDERRRWRRRWEDAVQRSLRWDT